MQALTQPIKLIDLKKAILEKAQIRNKELKKEFYSKNADEYEFVDVNVFSDYKLLLFRCPKSKSTVSLKVEK